MSKKAIKNMGNSEYKNFNLKLAISESFLQGFVFNKNE